MTSRGARHALLAITLALGGAQHAASELAGSSAPDFVLKSVAGENLRLSEYRGRVVMLSFWASWCGECRSQLAGLAHMYDTYSSAGFEVLAVSLDTRGEQVADTARTTKAAYPVLHDAAGEVGRLYEVSSMPMVVLIDREGVVRDVFEGYRRGNEEQYLERVRALLNE
jgi:peroxiredoxin